MSIVIIRNSNTDYGAWQQATATIHSGECEKYYKSVPRIKSNGGLSRYFSLYFF